MHALILGAGEVGRNIALAVAGQSAVDAITVADRDGATARSVADGIGARAVSVDVGDEEGMARLLADVDVIASSVGPATRHGVPILRQAIRAGKPFVDVCDDPEPTLAMLALDAEAQAARVPAIIGCGASPGIANLLAVEAASRLDTVERIVTAWGQGSDDDEDEDRKDVATVTAALEHWVEQISFPVPIWRGGDVRHVAPLESVTIDYPGVGRVVTRLVGHPEAVTLPRRYPDLAECLNVMDFSSYVFASLERVAERVRSGDSTIREGAEALVGMLAGDSRMSITDVASYAANSSKDALWRKKWLPPLCALAEGTRGGRKTSVGVSLNGHIPGGMGPVTAIPAAIAVGMIAAGSVDWFGVRAPEQALDPSKFFAILRHHLIDDQGAPLAASEAPIVVREAIA